MPASAPSGGRSGSALTPDGWMGEKKGREAQGRCRVFCHRCTPPQPAHSGPGARWQRRAGAGVVGRRVDQRTRGARAVLEDARRLSQKKSRRSFGERRLARRATLPGPPHSPRRSWWPAPLRGGGGVWVGAVEKGETGGKNEQAQSPGGAVGQPTPHARRAAPNGAPPKPRRQCGVSCGGVGPWPQAPSCAATGRGVLFGGRPRASSPRPPTTTHNALCRTHQAASTVVASVLRRCAPCVGGGAAGRARFL